MAKCDNTDNIINSCDYWKNYLNSIQEVTDKFELLEKIGEGAFAAVFLVKLKEKYRIKEKYALKFTIPIVTSNRIANEIRILKKLGGSNNIVRLHYAFRVVDKAFMVMEYIEHKKFYDYYLLLDKNEIRDYIKNLLIALRFIHAHKIIHRDIKPDNFLYDRKRKRYALVDFGLSHSENKSDLDKSFTHEDNEIENDDDYEENISPIGVKSIEFSGNCVCGDRFTTCDGCRIKSLPKAKRGGTMGYRAPEVIMGFNKQTVAIDVWAAGIIFASLLTRCYPFMKGASDLHILFYLVRLLSFERMQRAAHKISRRIVVQGSIKPLHSYDSRGFVEYLQMRCKYISNNNVQLTGTENESSKEKVDNNLNRINNPNNEEQHPNTNDSENFGLVWYDLLSKLLEPAHNKRVTAADALKHSLFKSNKM